MTWTGVIAVFVVVTGSITHADTFVCNEQPKSNPGDPHLPRVLEDNKSYQAHVELNILDQNVTRVIDEYLDYMGNQALLVSYFNGDSAKQFFSYDTDEVFHIEERKCEVFNLSSTSDQFGLGFTTDRDKRHVFGSGRILRFAADNHDVYKGNTTVRGIPVDEWAACVDWKGTQGKVRVSYYFTKPGWTGAAPGAVGPVPVRIVVEGLSNSPYYKDPNFRPGVTLPPGQGRYFHHVYDFINFQPIIVDNTVFQLPQGIVCSGRKETKPLPKFAKYFHYAGEWLTDNGISHYKVWYDEDYKLVRLDTRQERPIPPVYSTNTLTEIHDFTTGVRYIRDHRLGNCSVWPLNTGSFDSQIDKPRWAYNGSLEVYMKGPLAFFHFNENYTYSGQRTIRDIPCDVFSAVVPDYEVPDTGMEYEATFEFAFMRDGYVDLPLSGFKPSEMSYLVQIFITVPKLQYYSQTYNIFDYDEERVPLNVFDVSDCFDSRRRVDFKMTFTGEFDPVTRSQWEDNLPVTIMQGAEVTPVRVGKVRLTSDLHTVTAWGSVFASSKAAQFEVSGLSVLEKVDDKVIKGVTDVDECAQLCIDNDYDGNGFRCDSFDICVQDSTCRLSKTRIPDKQATTSNILCDHFSRTIANVHVKEPTLQDAYDRLEASVQTGRIQITVEDANMFKSLFRAIAIEQVSGARAKTKPLPSVPSQFSYRMETVIPDQGRSLETYVWYDKALGLVRFDQRDPFNDVSFEMTHIHDFNKGIAYLINQVTDICSVSPIPTDAGFFDVNVTGSAASPDGARQIQMKDPLGLLYLDDTYTYVGEQSVRGITCDVFESRRNDYKISMYNVSFQSSIFRYHFQSEEWDYTTVESNDMTNSQPVMLEIMDDTVGAFLVFNFFDFNDEHHAMKYYDISKCYLPDQKRDVVIDFLGQKYHPFLDVTSNTFINTAVLQLATATGLEPTHFQNVQLTYDETNVYLLFTLLGQVSPAALFSPTMRVGHNASAAWFEAQSEADCAASCQSMSSIQCNSFDYCGDLTPPTCLPGVTYSETEGDAKDPQGPCVHYSRSEWREYQTVSVDRIYNVLVDWVFSDKFTVTMNLPDQTKIYVGNYIRDNILRPSDPDSDKGAFLRKFVVTPASKFSENYTTTTHNQVSVADCAALCVQENTFECQAFSYQYSLGQCKLTDTHPDNIKGAVTQDVFTDLYARFYTAEYTKLPGEVIQSHADRTVSGITSDELCARACNQESSFRCESFETCTQAGQSGRTCLLKKYHQLASNVSLSSTKPSCSLYSRNHLYDYILREKQQVEGHDDLVLTTAQPDACAQHCSSGELLAGCKSFEMCFKERGEVQCILSTADPSTDHTLSISNTRECSLYTLANPKPVVINPTAPHTSGPSSSSASRPPPTSSRISSGTSTSRTPPSTTHLTPATAGEGPSSSSSTPTSGPVDICSGQQVSTDSDAAARAGIAMGTLVLGLVLGAVLTAVFIHKRYGVVRHAEDATMLNTWSSK